MIAHAQNCNICGMKEPKKTQQISNNEREIERQREREGEELKRGVNIACDPDLHLPPSLAGLSVAWAINHCQVSFALVDGSSSILYPCSFDSAASQVFHSTHTERGTVPHTHGLSEQHVHLPGSQKVHHRKQQRQQQQLQQ